MSYTLQNPLAYFPLPTKSSAAGLCKLYVGLIDTDPLTPSNQVQVYAVKPDGSELAIPQPILLSAGGVPQYNGSPVQLKIAADVVSVKVTTSIGALVSYTPRWSAEVSAAALAAVDSTVFVGGVEAGLFSKFQIVQPPSGDAGAFFNQLIASGVKNLFLTAGGYVFNTSLIANGVTLNMAGSGLLNTSLIRGASLGTANIISGSLHDLHISKVRFDMGKGSYTPTLSDPQLENAINSVSPKGLHISFCAFNNLVNLGIVVNGTALNEAKDIDISDNESTTGTRGFAMIRRYGDNVTVSRNTLLNTVDTANTLFKPIEVSGSTDVWICDNIITQNNNAGGPVIVEYIDRESVNVHIERNSYYGPAGEASYKVGAASNVWFLDNHCSGLSDIGAYFEGCENVWIERNRLVGARRNNLVLAQDFDTSRFNKKVKIFDNHFVDANRANATAGVPYTSTGSNDSYHVWIQDDTEQVELSGNHYIKGANKAGGLLISSPTYTIRNENMSLLDTAAVTINNSFSPVGAKYEIVDNIGCQTTAEGEITITGTSSAIIDPPIVAHYGSNTQLTLKTALSGSVAYVTAEPSTAPSIQATCKNSAHANTAPSSPVTLFWSVSCDRVVQGILGKTP